MRFHRSMLPPLLWVIAVFCTLLTLILPSVGLAGRMAPGVPEEPLAVDTDGDGLLDNYETAHGLNPNDPSDAALDPDNDGLTSLEEARLGTDPNNPDSDFDGVLDGEEVRRGTNPVPSTTVTLDENCVVAILNRVAQVRPDGTWMIQNVPTNFGLVRARATCVVNGVTHSGQSEPFLVPENGVITVGEIQFDVLDPIPTRLQVTAAPEELTTVGETSQLTVMAQFPDNTSRDVTTDPRTSYISSNAAVATVNAEGLVTAMRSSPALVTVLYEAVSSVVSLTVRLSDMDTDGDGIPDDVELANGLDPNNPIDAMEDADRDGLSNGAELTDIGTDFQVADTDGDGIRDGLEVNTGSDPFDPNSFDLEQALLELEITPVAVALTVNTIVGVASQQLTVTGRLRDGARLDLTARGTNYLSSDLTICNFGGTPGEVFAGQDGFCTVTAMHSGFAATATVTVRSFAPTALAFVDLPGFANNVAVQGDFAYVAAGAAGLQVVEVSEPATPTIIGSVDTPGNANDVAVVGEMVLLADGTAGLQLINVADPTTPIITGTIDIPGEAQDVVVDGNVAFVAAGDAGLHLVEIGSPGRFGTQGAASPLLATVDTPGIAKGVAVHAARRLAVVADGTAGIQVVDLTDMTNPSLAGSVDTGDARDVALSADGLLAFVADFASSFTVVDITNPSSPIVRTSTPQDTGGLLTDVVVVDSLAFGADVFFVNGVPIIDVSIPGTANPRLPSPSLDFRQFRDDNGTGIAVDDSFVYLTAERGITENGTRGDTRLYIGQYRARADNAGVPPGVSIVTPQEGATVFEGSPLAVRVEATDDIAVASVNFLVNGVVVATDATAPYEATIRAPDVASGLTLGAMAIDFGNNLGVAESVVVEVLPDPLTTVTGQVVTTDGMAVVGATVTIFDTFSVVTDNRGNFTIPEVPTARGDLRVVASFTTLEGMALRGEAVVSPVPADTTDTGPIVIGQLAYFGFNPNNSGQLKLLGWRDNTTFRLVNLDAIVATGAVPEETLDRFATNTMNLGAIRHFKLEVNTPLLVTLGFDCCAFGGSFFYPATDGRALVGRDFIIRIPVLNTSNEFIILAHEASDVTVTDTTTGEVVLMQTIPANGFFAATGPPLAANVVYTVTSTGNIAMQSNSRNAHATVPASNGTDVGTSFLFGTRQFVGITSVALFAYEDATVTGTNLETGAEAFTSTLEAGNFAYISRIGESKFRAVSTGRIAMWAGSNEGSDTIAGMGDDLTINTGDGGRNFLIHSQSQGAFVFALQNNTVVTVDGVETTLNADQFIDLPAQIFSRIMASKPVIIETIGGNGLNDWETSLLPVILGQ